jgi:3-hydroxybutyryl-CoA dehydrogenase
MKDNEAAFEIGSVAIVGGGLMGTGIAEVTALAGFPTTLVKATAGDPKPALERIQHSMQRRVRRDKLTGAEAEAALARITATADRSALAGTDLVIESIVEDLDSKRELFSDLDRRCEPVTVFASNTSTLRISDIARGTRRADRTIGMHFFSPVPAMSLVELAHLPDTDAGALAGADAFVSRLGKTAVPVLDSTGFVVNRLLVPYLIGAIAAYAQGLAGPDQIDTAMKLGCGHPLGPLALSDLIGLDVVYAMSKLLYKDFGESRYRPPALLRRLVQDGHVGKKTGLGFFDYSSKPPVPNEAILGLVRGGALKENRG